MAGLGSQLSALWDKNQRLNNLQILLIFLSAQLVLQGQVHNNVSELYAPDFERLLPVTAFERVHQGLIQVWQQAGQTRAQLLALTSVLENIAELGQNRAVTGWQSGQYLAYIVRLLDYIQIQLFKVKIKYQDSADIEVLKLLGITRASLVKLLN